MMSDNYYTLEKIAELNSKKNEIISKWKDNHYIQKYPTNERKQEVSYLLENVSKVTFPPNGGIELFYEKHKYAIVTKIWSRLVTKKFVNIKPLIEGDNRISYNQYTKKKHPHTEWAFIVESVLKSEEIETKKQNYRFTLWEKCLENLKMVNNLDPEKELVEIIAQEVTLEIERRILRNLASSAATVSAWDCSTALGDTINEKYESLYIKLVEVSDIINCKCLAGHCNFIVTSPEVASIFETATSGFLPEEFIGSLGISYIGVINHRWRLYKDPLCPTGQILMGHSGDSPYNRGLIVGVRNLFEIGGDFSKIPNDIVPRYPTCGDFEMKFIPGGEKYFARINVVNFIV